jgi:hypothetical protein
LITGLNNPSRIAVSGGLLFVTNRSGNTVGAYTTSGATVNPALISGLDTPTGIAVSGGNLFVANLGDVNSPSHIGTIGAYTTSGATIDPALISDPNFFPLGIHVSGGNLFVTNSDFPNGTIGEYTTSGAPINPALISGLFSPNDFAFSGSHLFVVTEPTGTIGQYTTSGATVNPALISGLNDPVSLVVASSVPDGSSAWMLLLLSVAAMFGLNFLLRRRASVAAV